MIPICRAKKIDNDEWVEGYLNPYLPSKKHWYIMVISDDNTHIANNEIDKNTLAIHFPNMIDKNGKKIFASLSEDGVGGDEIRNENELETYVAEHGIDGTHLYEYLDDKKIKNHVMAYSQSNMIFNELEVIGIHKG